MASKHISYPSISAEMKMMQLLVELFDKTHVVRVPQSTTVDEFLQKIEEKVRSSVEVLALGKPLMRGRSLRDCGVTDRSLVSVRGALVGGALLGKPVKGRSKDFERKFMKQREYDVENQKHKAARAELLEKMEVEKTNSRMNRLKIQNQWRKIMRLAKVDSLRLGIEILSQNHERDVDRKDAIIQMLDRDLEEAEDQFQTALRAHLQHVDELIELQDSRLLVAEREFTNQLDELQAEFGAEKEAIVKQHARDTQELNEVMANVDAEERERDAETKQEHEQLREEIRNRNLEEINMLRIHLDSQIEQKEGEFDSAHLAYLEQTNQCTLEFKFYTKKDQEMTKQIEIKMRKIERLQASLQHWRTKVTQNTKECARRNSSLLEEKNKIHAHFQRLKSSMNNFRRQQTRRLTQLTKNAQSARNKLNERVELAERILLLAELARKRETDQEKVIPFAPSDESGLDAPASPSKDQHLQTSCATRSGDQVREWCHLDNFLRKYNKVLLDKLAVERERERLERENADLQSMLKQYYDGVTVSEVVMDSDENNPLLVVNGKFSLAPRDNTKLV